MKTTKKKTMTKRLLLLRIFHFFDSLLTMWSLFLVCVVYLSNNFYCSWFKVLGIQESYDHTRNAVINYLDSPFKILCMDYEITDEITKPGYWCRTTSHVTIMSSFYDEPTNLYIGYDSYQYWWCLDYKYMPNITRTQAKTRAKLSVKYQTPAKINNLAYLIALLQ